MSPIQTKTQYQITKLSEADFPALHALIKHYSDQKIMLPKSMEELYMKARGFRLIKDEAGELLACAHLDIFGENLAEVKSLAVHPDHHAKGLGRIIVEDCEAEAKALGITKVFALTYQDIFFHKIGYKTIDIKTLPEKVFSECVHCPFYENCNEIAVLKFL